MKFIGRFGPIAAVAIPLCGVPQLSTADVNALVIGSGLDSCGAWTQDRRNNVALGEESWVAGFLSGVNTVYAAETPGTGNLGQKTDYYGLMAWIDGYCQAHPLDDLLTASIFLVGELKKDR